jgi:predicted lactoylglutathione lyase
MEITKISATEISVAVPVEIKTETKIYNIDFLKSQEIAITKQRDEMIALKEKELKEVQDLITQATTLGCKTTAEIEAAKEVVVDPIIEVPK